MTKKYLHFGVSVAGGMLITIFAQQTKFYLSYVLLVPGMIIQEYIPIYGILVIGSLQISILQVAFYTFLIYLCIRLMSRIRQSSRKPPARSSLQRHMILPVLIALPIQLIGLIIRTGCFTP
jgi:hypothetical protein